MQMKCSESAISVMQKQNARTLSPKGERPVQRQVLAGETRQRVQQTRQGAESPLKFTGKQNHNANEMFRNRRIGEAETKCPGLNP